MCDRKEQHVYTIPQYIYDPKSPLNIIGVPALGTLFGDNADVHSPLAEDGTTVISKNKISDRSGRSCGLDEEYIKWYNSGFNTDMVY